MRLGATERLENQEVEPAGVSQDVTDSLKYVSSEAQVHLILVLVQFGGGFQFQSHLNAARQEGARNVRFAVTFHDLRLRRAHLQETTSRARTSPNNKLSANQQR